MDAVYTYISVLVDTLQKKKNILEKLYVGTSQQKEILQSDKFDEEAFQKTIIHKGMLLGELEQLDKGFEQVYERVALAMKHNKDMYKNEILKAQQLVQEVMDLSVCIQAMEEQNKERFPAAVMEKRKQLGGIRNNSRMVNNYYRSMPNMHQTGQSYFLDKKK